MSDPNANRKKRQTILMVVSILGISFLVIAGMFLFDQGPPRKFRSKPQTVNITPPGSLDDRDAWRAQQAAQEKTNEEQIQNLQSQLIKQREEQEKLTEAFKELQSKPGKPGLINDTKQSKEPVSQRRLSDPLPSTNTGKPSVLRPPTLPPRQASVSTLNTPVGVSIKPPARELEIISFSNKNSSPGKKGRRSNKSNKNHKDIDFLDAGTFVRVAMLNGVDAPTGGQAQSDPLPVAFHVVDEANLANKYKLDIKDCRFIVAAWGDLSSERMLGRTDSLTCIINGESVHLSVKGQVIGEDGKVGVRGRLVEKKGQILANALLAGGLAGVGDAVKQSSSITSISGGGITQTLDTDRLGRAAVGGGLSKAAESLADYYLKAADMLFPVIETDAGRIVEILITKPASLSGNSLAINEYHALLKRPTSFTRRFAND